MFNRKTDHCAGMTAADTCSWECRKFAHKGYVFNGILLSHEEE
jgi:hypothetical protein